MKEVIKNKLSRIQDLEERRLLKDILNYTFSEMIDYCDASYQHLVDAVFDQMDSDKMTHKIYTTISKVEDYDPIDSFMYPMKPEDIEKRKHMTDDILYALQEKGTAIIGRTFLQCDYLELEKILEAGKIYAGEIVTESGRYPVHIKLQLSSDYISCISDLYYDYLANGIEWTTVNAPYIYKFVDFAIQECAGLPAGEEIETVHVDLGEAQEFRYDNMIPLWNLESIQMQSTNFPIPTKDNIHFQHKITLNEKNTAYNYIVRFGRKNEYDGYCVRDSESVSIILALDTIDYWPAYRIKDKDEEVIYDYQFPLISNGCHDTFMVRYAKNESKIIHTKAELIRKVLSYEAVEGVKVSDITFIEPGNELVPETYPVNTFIEEDIRKDSSKKVMLIEYTAGHKDYMTRDLMSFVLSEVQRYFPEYKCEGRML